MPDRAEPSSEGPGELERSLGGVARTALGVAYGGVALLGALHLDARTTMVAAPFFAILTTALRWSIHQALHPRAAPSVALLLPAATVGALVAPFGVGVERLGDRGAYLVLVLIGLVTVLGCQWLHRLEVPTARAGVDDQPSPPPRRPAASAHDPPRELLRGLSLDDLVDEWRRSDELFGRMPATDRRAAVAWRACLLDELERRDPRGFTDWVLDGTTRGPEHHIRAAPDGATAAPDDPAR